METGPRYELTELLGSGGMGRVYGAIHHPSGTEVAVKVLREGVRNDPWRRRLLLNEATAAARLRHRNIVQLLDLPGAGTDGTTCLVLERVNGVDLATWLDPWPGWSTIAAVMADVLRGLAAAHAAGIVHGDLKPGNVLVATGGNASPPPAKITDFGIARVRDPISGEESITGTAGTPLYMAPEQFLGEEQIGPWSDLYAIGVMLHEILAGVPPFPPASPVRMATAKLQGPAALLQPRPGLRVPEAMRRLVDQLLAPNPRARPRFAAALQQRLAELASTLGDGIEPGTAPPPALVAGDTVVESSGPPRHERKDPLAGDTRVDDPSALPSGVVVVAGGLAQNGSHTAAGMAPTLASDHPAAPAGAPAHMPGLTFLEGRAIAAPLHVKHGGALLRLREPPLVGRSVERSILDALVEEVVGTGGARILALLGEPGVGKSRVARWGLSEMERRGQMEGVAAGYGPSGADANGGLRRAVRSLVRLPHGGVENVDAVSAAWGWLARADGSLPFDARALAGWLGDAGAASLDPVQASQLAGAVFRAASRVRPVYLWLDDLAWADDGGLEMVEGLAADPDAAVLMVTTFRTGTTQSPAVRDRLQALFDGATVRVHTVEPFGVEDRVLLLQSLVPLAPDAATALAATLNGTPLLLVQLVYDWIESGRLVDGPLGWRLPTGRTPESMLKGRPLDALINQRFEGLLASFGEARDAAEQLLLLAALLGNRFDDAAFRAAAGANPATGALVDTLLDHALFHGLLRSTDVGAYRFDHGTAREALLARVEKHPRHSELEIATAAALLECYGPERGDTGMRAAQLYHDAGESDAAWEALGHAIHGTSWSGAFVMSEQYLKVARRWLQDVPAEEADFRRAQLRLAEGRLRFYDLQYDDALTALEDGREALHRLGIDPEDLGDPGASDPRRASALGLYASCVTLIGDVLFYQDRFPEAERTLKRAYAFGTAVGDAGHYALAHSANALAHIAALRGDLAGSRGFYNKRVSAALAAGNERLLGMSLVSLACLAFAEGKREEAEDLLIRTEATVHPQRGAGTTGEVQDLRARLLMEAGRPEEARRVLHPRIREVEALTDRWRLTSLRSIQAEISLALDPPEEARHSVRAFIDSWLAVHHDEVQVVRTVQRLIAALRERGEAELASEVSGLLAKRRAEIDARLDA